jgi:CCR4-NOT complex subunit CAF16
LPSSHLSIPGGISINMEDAAKPVVCIKNLSFSYDKGKKNIDGLDCVVPPNSKVILVGANGAGKSTLLRILTGVVYLGLEHDEFDINGNKNPNDQANGVAYLGGVWKRRRTGFEGIEPFSVDIAARDMMKGWQEDNLERRDELVRILGINLDWRMHQCSDGQRKKVRIMLKLLRPFRLCVIDEFAADLDIFSRKRFFDYLTAECLKRNASVVYATHIFDQADVWATHVAFMQLDKVLSPIYCLKTYGPYQEVLARTGEERAMCPMYVLVLEELERQYRAHSKFFTDDNQCLTDTIMDAQGCEQEGLYYENANTDSKNSGYEAGRLARTEAIKSMKEEGQKRWDEKVEEVKTQNARVERPKATKKCDNTANFT